MGALQDVVNCRLMSRPPFAVRRGERRKIKLVRQRVNQETAAANSNEDQVLVERALAGDSAAQSRLFATHARRLHRIAFNVLRNKEDAEDAVQDCWCSAYSNLHTFEGRSSFSTWLTRIVINSALMIRRRNKRQFLTSLDEVSDDAGHLRHSLVDEQPTAEETYQNAEMNELLMQEIQKLPSSTRTAFLLRDVDELSTSESLERLGINESALKSRVLRARRRIAQNVRESLHADPQRKCLFIWKDCPTANGSSTAILSSGGKS